MIKGSSVSPGYAIGKVKKIIEPVIIKPESINIVDEKEKLRMAIQKLVNNYDEILSGNYSNQIKEITEIYKMMILSDSLQNKLYLEIDKNVDIITSIDNVVRTEYDNFLNMDNNYFKERANDVLEIGKNLINIIIGRDDSYLKNINVDTILVSNEITASDLLGSNQNYVKGIVSNIGGKTSHVALLAKSMGMPAVFNVNINEITDEALYFIDGYKGEILEIKNNEISKYQVLIEKQREKELKFLEMISKDAITTDGKRFEVCANAADLEHLDSIISTNPDGVGLFRTEFLFLNRTHKPTLEEQFEVYKAYASKLKDKPLIIRTLDIGGDKVVDYLNISKEDNSFLGYRAIRYCLGNMDIFIDHLKAILMSSHYGNVMIMFPMVSNVEEIRLLKKIVEDIKSELRSNSIPFNENIKMGIMIEIPSVAVIADLIIDEVDFFSIGTNDLTQYTLAVDRTNEKISHLYNYFDPAVIRLIKHTIDSVPSDKFVGMCGEVAADPYAVILLVGLGLYEFSVNEKALLKVKKWISLLNYEECKKISADILKLKTAKEIEDCLIAQANIYLKGYL